MKNFGVYTKISKQQNKDNSNEIMKNLLSQILVNNPNTNSFQNNITQTKEEHTNLGENIKMPIENNVQMQSSTILQKSIPLYPQPK